MDEQSVGPALVLGGVSQPRDVPPDVDEGLLRGILGKVRVTEHALRGPVEAWIVSHGERLEGSLIPALYPNDQFLVHIPHP